MGKIFEANELKKPVLSNTLLSNECTICNS